MSSKNVIAIVGFGNVGQTLGKAWHKQGHRIVFTSRTPDGPKKAALAQSVPGAELKAIDEGVALADVVLLALPWNTVAEVVPPLAAKLAGKVVIDVSVPFIQFPLVIGTGDAKHPSAGEAVQAWLPQSKVVKAFSTMGTSVMERPDFGAGTKVQTMVCGNDAAARQVVANLAAEIGFEPIDLGALVAARDAEAVGSLWCHLAHVQKLGGAMGVNIALNMIRRHE